MGFYESLYKSSRGEFSGVEGLKWSSISVVSVELLEKPLEESKIKCVVFNCDGNKARGIIWKGGSIGWRNSVFNRFSEAEKLAVAAVSMEGEAALVWFQWVVRWCPIRNWSELKLMLLDRFRLTQEGSICEKFLSLKQEGSVSSLLPLY